MIKTSTEMIATIADYESVEVLTNHQDKLAILEFLLDQRHQLNSSQGDSSDVKHPMLLRMEITEKNLDDLIQHLKQARSDLE